MGVAGRHDPEQVEEPLELLGPEAQLVEEDEVVDGDEPPGDDGRATVRDGVADRDQVHAPGNARTPARCRCKGSAAVPVNWAALYVGSGIAVLQDSGRRRIRTA